MMMNRRPRLGFVAIAMTVVCVIYLIARPNVGSAALDRIKKTADAIYEDDWNRPAAKAAEAAARVQEADLLGKPAPEEDSKSTAKTNGNTITSIEQLVKGKPISSKMQNQTVRAELGRAAWKVLHTILAQYPEDPNSEERETLVNYLHLFSRVYPCRECAEHFQVYLAKYPPQVSSRQTAMLWGCDVHNKVNKRLGKPIFDCAYIYDMYDCGCSDGPENPDEHKGMPVLEESVPSVKGA